MKRFCLVLIFALIYSVPLTSQTCLPDGISFYTQSQIDNFQVDYPDCDTIIGDVSIGIGYPSDITGLTGLNAVKAIGGKLDINNHTLLTSLSGLDALESIGGDFILEENESISNVSALGALNHVGGAFFVVENDVLTDLGNFEELTEIGGLFTIGHNPVLTSIDMKNLSSVGGIDFSYMFSLESLEGLESLETVGGNLVLRDCSSLPNLDGLNSLTTVQGILGLYDNELIDNLDGLESLTTVTGSFVLSYAAGYCISDISGLNSLTSVGGDFEIAKTNVTSLDGLESLTSINGDLEIVNNRYLASIEGIKNINSQGILDLAIRFNPMLSECAVNSICDFLGVSSRWIQIHDNAEGCNSQEQVIDDCTSGIGDNSNNSIAVSPNPAETEIYISTAKGELVSEVRIMNKIGEVVIVTKSHNIDVSSLPGGVYFVLVKYNNKQYIEKLVIN